MTYLRLAFVYHLSVIRGWICRHGPWSEEDNVLSLLVLTLGGTSPAWNSAAAPGPALLLLQLSKTGASYLDGG